MHALWIVPILSAFIGWITNMIAVKMLFHPKKPIHLPFFKIQGVIPRRKPQIAKSIAHIFDQDLFSGKDLGLIFEEMEMNEQTIPLIDEKIDKFIHQIKIDIPMASLVLNGELSESLKLKARGYLMEALPKIKEQLSSSIHEEGKIKIFIEDKINNFSIDKLESMIWHVATKELRTIEILGGVLGLIIGLLQCLLLFIL